MGTIVTSYTSFDEGIRS